MEKGSMLELARVEEVQAMLAAGYSQRRTSRESGVSRGTVAAIQHGRWAVKLRGIREAREAAGEEDSHPAEPTGGRAAEIRAAARQAAKRKDPESIRRLFAQHGPPELQLAPNEQARYLELRLKLQAEGKLPADDAYDSRDAA